MAFAGGLGIDLDVSSLSDDLDARALLFSESNSRFLCEVPESKAAEFKTLMADNCQQIGSVTGDRVVIRSGDQQLLDSDLTELKAAWQQPLDWK